MYFFVHLLVHISITKGFTVYKINLFGSFPRKQEIKSAQSKEQAVPLCEKLKKKTILPVLQKSNVRLRFDRIHAWDFLDSTLTLFTHPLDDICKLKQV